MGLSVYYSEKIEDLAWKLKQELLAERANADPFEFSSVVVPNANIAKWLRVREFASEPSLCAAVEFPFIEQALFRVLNDALPERVDLLPMNAYATAIMGILLAEPRVPSLAPFHDYIEEVCSLQFAVCRPERVCSLQFAVCSDGRADFSSAREKDAPRPLQTANCKLQTSPQLQTANSLNYRPAWQLAAKLADLMDEYEVRRPEIVERWLDGRGMSGGEYADDVEAAEAEIARRLFGENGAYPPSGNRLSLRQIFDRVCSLQFAVCSDGRADFSSAREKDAPQQLQTANCKLQTNQQQQTNQQLQTANCKLQTNQQQQTANCKLQTNQQQQTANCKLQTANYKRAYRFFGLSTLSPLQVRIIRWLAKHAKVEVYHNNVCTEYWGDIETRREERRLYERLHTCPDDTDLEIENPLLREWGVAGRETMRLLARLEEEGDEDVAFEWLDVTRCHSEPDCVLHAVQSGVWKRTSALVRRPQDSSLQIVAAPGLRREVEMVYNAILGQMLEGGKGDFSDIAVLVPDMAKYRPIIEAVFDARGEIPFGMIDTSASGRSECLDAFTALMALAQNGFDRKNVFAALDNICIQRALGFASGDARRWRETAQKIGAFAPYDDDGNFSNFSWESAFMRLREANDAAEEPNEQELNLAEVVDWLHDRLSPLAEEIHTGAEWAKTIGEIVDELIDVGDDFREEGVRRSIFETLHTLSSIAGVHPLSFAASAVEEFVGGVKHERGGYLTRGVTIASLQPMRPVPFRTVFVLGLGEGDFPGRESPTTLDMRGAKRRLGDSSTPLQNRYIFLETLMAVRDRLVISYRSLDAQKDAELFPSGMVCELEKFIANAILPDGEKFREIRLPLLERGEQGEDIPDDPMAVPTGTKAWHSGVIPTYSNVQRRLASSCLVPRASCLDDSCLVPRASCLDDSCLVPRASCLVSDDDALNEARSTRHEARNEARGTNHEARDIASFIADPLGGVMNKRFGIRIEQRGGECVDSPLGLPDKGPVRRSFDERVFASEAADAFAAVWDEFASEGLLPRRDTPLGKYSADLAAELYSPEFLATAHAFAQSLAPEKPDNTSTPNPQPSTLNSQHSTLNSQHSTLNSQHSTLNAQHSTLIIGSCGDDAKTHKMASFPPKSSLRPFVEWLKKISQPSESGDVRSFTLGVVDFAAQTCATWRWGGITPSAARAYLRGVEREYDAFTDTADADGKYLQLKYANVISALVKLKMSALPSKTDKKSWRKLCCAMEEPFTSSQVSFTSVVANTLGEHTRDPMEDDWLRVRDFVSSVLSLPLAAERS